MGTRAVPPHPQTLTCVTQLGILVSAFSDMVVMYVQAHLFIYVIMVMETTEVHN